jgi:hypothetical protein
VFFNLEGKIDTTSDASADISKMQPFKYRIGTDANYKQVSMPINNYIVSPDQTTYIHMYADCNRIFNGIKLSDANNLTVNSLSDNNNELAQKIVNNLPSIFIYE